MKAKQLFTAILLFIATLVNAQKLDTAYKKEWILIDSFIAKNNLTKSALNKVEAIYNQAKKKQQNAQAIKALIYKMELSNRIKEDNLPANIDLLKKEIETTQNIATKSILWSLLAKQYSQYYSNNSWQINGRSQTTEKKKDDITVWSKDDFTKQIFYCHDKSIEAKNELQKAKLNDFDVLIIYGTEAELRPTLYDILAHEALDYYKNYNSNSYYDDESSNTKITDAKALAIEHEFLNAIFTKDDASSKALQLFQQLISYHKKDKNPNPTIDVAIERISWVYSKAHFINKDELYIKALQELTTDYKTNTTAAQAWYLQAKFYSDKANNYKAFIKTENRYDNQKALSIIDERLKLNSDSCEGNLNMKALKEFILRKTISTKVEAVNVPNQAFRMLVNYKNTDKIYYRIIQLKISLKNYNEDDDSYSNDDKFWNKIVKKNYVKQIEQPLPLANDYQEHSCEVKVDALQAGTYAILTSTSANFDADKDKLSYLQFSVSSLSYIENNGDVFVVDRDNGNPIENATVKVFINDWDIEKRQYLPKQIGSFITNIKGFVSVKEIKNNNYGFNLIYTLSKNFDTLINGNNNFTISRNTNDKRTEKEIEEENAQIHFYTDRSIYRPNQTVYFKGIVTTKNKDANEFRIFNNMPANKVYLRNVNGKNIDSLEVTVNEFGSFNGKFILPKNELTGSFSLTTKLFNGYTNFNVEEYKRPKFFVDFDKQKSIYKLNQTITVTGNAKAYAGNNIDAAKVVYTVIRKARFENIWYFWRMPRPNTDAKQIKNGELKTDANGKFVIDFIAEPDVTVDRNTNPIFDYEVRATVTDINGETRENTSNISVGYNSIILKLDVPEKVNINNFKNIKIIATNLAGESINTMVDVKISQLQTPTRLIRERFWERADTFVLSKDEYIKNFPYDEYDNETDKLNWKETAALYRDIIATNKDSAFTRFDVKFANITSNAQLLITAKTKDADGNDIETKSFVEVFDEVKNDIYFVLQSHPQYHSPINIKTTAKAGETASIGFNTNAQNVFVLKNLVTGNDKPNEETQKNDYSFEQITNNFSWNKTLDTKGFGMFYAFVKNNRFYKGGSNIELIKPSKKLNITYGTFRNKTLPGSKETYTVKLSNENGEKVNAELLTAMYDASLDQFRGHNWLVPEFEEKEYYSSSLNSKCFSQAMSQLYHRKQSRFSPVVINDKYNKLSSHLLSLMYYDENNVVVQVGYGTVKKTAFTGSEATVSSSNLKNKLRVPNKIEVAQFTPPRIISLVDGDADGITDQFDSEPNKSQTPNSNRLTPRKNFNETAFFFPNVYADSSGNYTFSFTMPEALTKWKWLSLAHTKNLDFGVNENSVVTAKPLMVQPNTPRFLREGDVMELTAKIVNTTDKELTGTATLEFVDATTGNSVDGLFNNVFPLQYFTAAANQSSIVKFPTQVPMNFAKPLTVRIVATVPTTKGNDMEIGYSDGEENTLPVLTNKIFLTESLPIYLKSNEAQKTVDLKPLFSTATNRSNESITIEYTANPIWSVVQALPYLMEYPYECAEQTFNRFFANAMASSIVNNNQNVKRVIEKWKADTTLVKSKLQVNEELKSILLNETPWVLDAESEVEQQKRLSLLLDLDKMQNNINTTIENLQSKQLDNGAFSWFDGGRENQYITQYIVTGIGKLRLLNALNKEQQKQLDAITSKALKYLDSKEEAEYKLWVNSKIKNKVAYCGNPTDINYWYMRSMFTDVKLSATLQKAFKVFASEINKNWIKESVYTQAMSALSIKRFNGANNLTKKIMNSIKENAFEDTAKGTMYWKQNQYCYYWYQNNFETQALLIQAFAEMNNSDVDIEKMKTWLILNKQTNSWKSTISTSAACYALLNYGSRWLNDQQRISTSLPNKTIESNNDNGGYVKQKLDDRDLIAVEQTKTITVITDQSTKNSPSYGSVYYQYFADVNDVKSSATNTPLSLVKKLFIEKNNGTKKVLEPVNDGDELNVGDKLIVRIELRADRQMEFLHLKDMRAANTEPLNVICQYKWQDGLGYYESTKDASTNFFIDYMQRGTYVFEYPLFITHSGTYSVGLAQIQCMYAPEFISHSNGIKINVR